MSTESSMHHTLSTDRRVISASRRTDIPAFYAEWFMNRIRRGVVAVPNPNNARQISWQSLRPETVEAIVFWTKDARPLLPYLHELDDLGYRYYFQYTLTGYPAWLEPRTPHAQEALDAFLATSARVGPQRVVWRYDPIFFPPGMDERWHVERFTGIASALSGATQRCVISFLDVFRKTASNLARSCASSSLGPGGSPVRPFPLDLRGFGETLAHAARAAGIEITTCAEPPHVVEALGPGVTPGKCVDNKLLLKLGVEVSARKDSGQREACDCVRSREIGMYDSCQHGCAYCYATISTEVAAQNAIRNHHPESASLLGEVADDECPPWPDREGQLPLI